MSNERAPTDPPVRPIDDSDRWYVTGPEPIWHDEKTAVLMVRVGMAQNALLAEMDAASLAIDGVRTGARRLRLSLTRLVSSAALIFEAARLAKENMAELRRLATSGHRQPRPGLLDEIGQLCAGKHAASAMVTRARKKVGFHWDADVIGASVVEYGKNAQLVWLEAHGDEVPLHRLSSDVLAHVLFPETDTPDPASSQRAASVAMGQFGQAITLIVEFFTAATYGYLKQSGAERQERTPAKDVKAEKPAWRPPVGQRGRSRR
jgi:hypothetical protein